MATFLYKVGRSAYLHRWRFIAIWILLILGAGTAAATLTQPMSNSFTIEGLESVETQERIQERFPGEGDALEAPTGTVVMQARDGAALTDPEVSAEVDAFLADLRGLDELADAEALVSPVLAAGGVAQQMNEQYAAQGMPQEQIDANIAAVSPLSEDAATGTVTVTFDADGAMDVTPEAKDAFTAVVDEHDDNALDIAYSGNVFQMSELSFIAELLGIAVAAVVLIITFGSFVAAGLPLLTGVIGVGIGIAGVYAATSFTDSITSMTPTLAVMIGLDPATLAETVSSYNSYCETGVDAEFGKDAALLTKVGEGPYYALAMASYSYNTCAGLDINENMQVLDTNGQVMEGLFCVGSDSAGVLFSEKKPYVTFGGANNGWALTSAYVGGQIIADMVNGK